MLAKITDFVKAYHADIVLGVAIMCITIISFNLGRVSVGQGSGTKSCEATHRVPTPRAS